MTVHNHGPEEGPGLACNERDVDGRPVGACIARNVQALADEPYEDLLMDAYYYGFAPTGVTAIDRILSAVAHAGRAYHHTESWNDDWMGRGNYLPHGGDNAAEAIQNAANAAAEAVRSLSSKPATDKGGAA